MFPPAVAVAAAVVSLHRVVPVSGLHVLALAASLGQRGRPGRPNLHDVPEQAGRGGGLSLDCGRIGRGAGQPVARGDLGEL